MAMALTDRKAVGSVVRLGPPAVENRQIQAAVEDCFLAAGAGRFERTPRIVQPDIDPLHHVPADVDVIILDIRDAVSKPRIATHAGDHLNESLPWLVLRMRLACKHE